jgi:hypothetical protein
VENVFPNGQKRQKLFPPKTFVRKKGDGRNFCHKFFSNSRIKKFLILKMNIFLDFSFSKKQ